MNGPYVKQHTSDGLTPFGPLILQLLNPEFAKRYGRETPPQPSGFKLKHKPLPQGVRAERTPTETVRHVVESMGFDETFTAGELSSMLSYTTSQIGLRGINSVLAGMVAAQQITEVTLLNKTTEPLFARLAPDAPV